MALEPLPDDGEPVFFAINSFGYGGTNAHALLESPPRAVAVERAPSRTGGVLPVSARSEAALRALVTRYRDELRDAGNRLAGSVFGGGSAP